MDNGQSPSEQETRREPRTRGESARLPVQIALALLILFFGLLLLWLVWPFVTGA